MGTRIVGERAAVTSLLHGLAASYRHKGVTPENKSRELLTSGMDPSGHVDVRRKP